MRIWDGLANMVRDSKNKVARQHREYIGKGLADQAQEQKDRASALDQREREISEREKNLAKYYLIPRIYVQLPLALLVMAGVLLVYKTMQPSVSLSETADGSSEPVVAAASEPDYSTCVRRGVSYYNEIGSYPVLSTGEDAQTKVQQMCGNSGFAFAE